MNVVEGETFEGQDVWIDFSSYRGCTFNNCNIVVEFGIFELRNNDFNGCRLTVRGIASNIIRLAKLFYPVIPIAGEERTGIDGTDLEKYR